MYQEDVETGRKNRDVVMSGERWGPGVGFLLTRDRFLVALLAFPPSGSGLGPWQGFGLSFLSLSTSSAARETSVLAHTKRAGRVGVGDSAEPGSGR